MPKLLHHRSSLARFCWGLMLVLALTLMVRAETAASKQAATDLSRLVTFGPRVAGTPQGRQALDYLLNQYRQAGYDAVVQPFTYTKFDDLGSSLMVKDTRINGLALTNSVGGKITAPLVLVPNAGRPADFARVSVKGALALVRRGEIHFTEKAHNAAQAGAVGLIVVNSEAGELLGLLNEPVEIPVFALSGVRGRPLLQNPPTTATLAVSTRREVIKGQNLIAHLPGIDRPRILLGGHYDSVPGSPGANDNASGTAVVLNLARRLAGTSTARVCWFLAFDGEEDGLEGSQAFVEQAPAGLLKGLGAMLNFDMVGVNEKLLVGGTDHLTAFARRVDPALTVFPDNQRSDHASFIRAGVPAIFFYRGEEPNYHQPGDVQVDTGLLERTVQTALTLVRKFLESEQASL
ncbi:M28 family peptidase [Anthocerotibacter panamensis]|uniref:M28 family peptidase n=1 Tax=Anthocerotibacter panamensis TaxID=2857077 RepID=UPI001C403BEE|nr:M28 family peptidase [Anthocerotibacter panamensis]